MLQPTKVFGDYRRTKVLDSSQLKHTLTCGWCHAQMQLTKEQDMPVIKLPTLQFMDNILQIHCALRGGINHSLCCGLLGQQHSTMDKER